MNKESKNKKLKKGFTLIEMLVVVLIIGILAGIALPQYQMAVTKAKVAAILPMMRHIKDSYMEWKLANGSYCKDKGCNESYATIFDIGVDCPDGWTCDEESGEMENDYWDCWPNEERSGMVYCSHEFNDDDGSYFEISMCQPDDEEICTADTKGKTICSGISKGQRICKALGGKLIQEDNNWANYSF